MQWCVFMSASIIPFTSVAISQLKLVARVDLFVAEFLDPCSRCGNFISLKETDSWLVLHHQGRTLLTKTCISS